MSNHSHGDRTLEHILAEAAEREAVNVEAMHVALQTKAHMVNMTTGNYDVTLKSLGCTQDSYDHEIRGWITVWVDASGKDLQIIGDFILVPAQVAKTAAVASAVTVKAAISDDMTSAAEAIKTLNLDFATWLARIKNAIVSGEIKGGVKAQNHLQQHKAPLSAIAAWVKSQESD